MPENWNTYSLGDLIEHQKGFAFKSKWYQNSGAIIVRVSDTTANSIDVSTCNKIDKDLARAYERFKIQFNDIVIATVGSWPPNYASVVGKVIKVPQEADGSLLNQNAVRLRTKNSEKFDQKFIYYLMKSDTFLKYIVHSAQGSANQASIKLTDIFNFSFSLPKISEQKSIASILSALDDKIELNLQMNKTLEEMAMALYRHWFVEFEPFQDEEFVDVEVFGTNRTLSIPSTFKLLSVKKNIDRFKSKNKYNQKNVLPKGNIRVFDQSSSRILGYHNNDADFKGKISDPFLIFGDHTCRLELVCENFSVGPNLIPFKPKEPELTYVMYFALSDKVKMNDYKRHWSELMLHEIIIPKDLQNIKNFNAHIRENFELIYENEIENQTLTQLRDTLLPKLISGEVRVKDVEKTLSEVL